MSTVPVEREETRPRNPVTWMLLGLVRGYQLIVSPWLAPTCKYYPSCSAYAVTALRRHGPVRGTTLAVWRLLRCNPWSNGGVDHVPPRRSGPIPSQAPPGLTLSQQHQPVTTDDGTGVGRAPATPEHR